ncbi:MAG: divalent-cation tolerance protein CutA [Candidatus Aureabacteria bacterium]|nr:divalent-cation tolerance protein CutA [Candidatus Auribacterota bacterium]
MKRSSGTRVVVFMTCDREREALAIARALLRRKIAACVSIYPRGRSLYWWKGRIEQAREFLLIAKTRRSLLAPVMRIVKSLHHYEVPEIVAVPISAGSADYLRWLDEEVADGRKNEGKG